MKLRAAVPISEDKEFFSPYLREHVGPGLKKFFYTRPIEDLKEMGEVYDQMVNKGEYDPRKVLSATFTGATLGVPGGGTGPANVIRNPNPDIAKMLRNVRRMYLDKMDTMPGPVKEVPEFARDLLRGVWWRGQRSIPKPEAVANPQGRLLRIRQREKQFNAATPDFRHARLSQTEFGEPAGISLTKNLRTVGDFSKRQGSLDETAAVLEELSHFSEKARHLYGAAKQTYASGSRVLPLVGPRQLLYPQTDEGARETARLYAQLAKREFTRRQIAGTDLSKYSHEDLYQLIKSKGHAFNEDLSEAALQKGYKGILYDPTRYNEHELKVFNPRRVVHIDERQFVPGTTQRELVKEAAHPYASLFRSKSFGDSAVAADSGIYMSPMTKYTEIRADDTASPIARWMGAGNRNRIHLRDIYKNIDLEEILRQPENRIKDIVTDDMLTGSWRGISKPKWMKHTPEPKAGTPAPEFSDQEMDFLVKNWDNHINTWPTEIAKKFENLELLQMAAIGKKVKLAKLHTAIDKKYHDLFPNNTTNVMDKFSAEELKHLSHYYDDSYEVPGSVLEKLYSLPAQESDAALLWAKTVAKNDPLTAAFNSVGMTADDVSFLAKKGMSSSEMSSALSQKLDDLTDANYGIIDDWVMQAKKVTGSAAAKPKIKGSARKPKLPDYSDDEMDLFAKYWNEPSDTWPDNMKAAVKDLNLAQKLMLGTKIQNYEVAKTFKESPLQIDPLDDLFEP